MPSSRESSKDRAKAPRALAQVRGCGAQERYSGAISAFLREGLGFGVSGIRLYGFLFADLTFEFRDLVAATLACLAYLRSQAQWELLLLLPLFALLFVDRCSLVLSSLCFLMLVHLLVCYVYTVFNAVAVAVVSCGCRLLLSGCRCRGSVSLLMRLLAATLACHVVTTLTAAEGFCSILCLVGCC